MNTNMTTEEDIASRLLAGMLANPAIDQAKTDKLIDVAVTLTDALLAEIDERSSS